MIDIHSHILWNIDDGPTSVSQSLDMIRLAIQDGVTCICATPHIKEPHFFQTREKLETSFQVLCEQVKLHNMDIKLVLGAENYVGAHSIHKLEKQEFMTYGNTSYMLIEFAWTINSYDHLDTYIEMIIQAGYTPIIAHPERYEWVEKDYGLIHKWRAMGALMQINRTSLIGSERVSFAQRLAFKMLDDNSVDFIASDAHHCFAPRYIKLSDVYHLIKERYGVQKAEYYFVEQPNKLIEKKRDK